MGVLRPASGGRGAPRPPAWHGACALRARRDGVRAAFSLLAIAAHAETFDLVSFTVPAGRRRATAEAASFTDATPASFAVAADADRQRAISAP